MDLNDYPTERSRDWKSIALIVGGVVLLIVVVFVGVQMIQRERQEAVVLENGGSQAISALQACEQATDSDACEGAVLTNLAQQYASSEMCEMLSGQEEKDNCYWGIAREIQEDSFCRSISGEISAQQCVDDISLSQALSSNDASICDDIQDEGRRERCRAVFEEPISAENCSERAPELCDDLILLEQALSSFDEEVCKAIQDEETRLICHDRVEDVLQDLVKELDLEEVTDTDGDRLLDTDEIVYGTDPTNPDTDGDGFLDGEEVASGYDPNGPGRLEE